MTYWGFSVNFSVRYNPATNFSALHVESNSAQTTVDIGNDHIKLLGVDHVTASDFLFHV
jgi:hypothetical protein